MIRADVAVGSCLGGDMEGRSSRLKGVYGVGWGGQGAGAIRA